MRLVDLFENSASFSPKQSTSKQEKSKELSKMEILEHNISKVQNHLFEGSYVQGLTTIAKSFLNLFEDNSLDWEPQPEFRGREGITTSTHDAAVRQRTSNNTRGSQTSNNRYDRKMNEPHPDGEKINQYWNKYLNMMKKATPQQRATLLPALKKIVAYADQRNVELSPDPKSFK